MVVILRSGDAWAPTTRCAISHVPLARSNCGSLESQGASPQRRRSMVLSMSSVEAELISVEDKIPKLRMEKEPPRDDELQLELKDKIINGLFLSAAFGYALYTIFSIDQGLTRGWTAR